MKRTPSEFLRVPPSPRTLSVTRMPRTLMGHTMPVGWNWMHSMSMSSAPASRARVTPSPVDSQELEVNFQHFPTPPVPSTMALALKTARRPLAVHEEALDVALHVHVDAEVDHVLLQGTDQLEAGAVAHVGEARVAVAAEVALADQPFLGSVEEGAPLLELQHAVGRLLGVQLGHAPVVEHLAAAHGVAEVDLPVVLLPYVAHGGGDAPLRHHGVGLAEEGLADQPRLEPRRPRLDGRAQPGSARSDDQHVVLVAVVGIVGGH